MSTMTQGDLKPDLVIELRDEDEHGNPLPVNLLLATTVHVTARQNGVVLFTRPATSVTPTGVVTVSWAAGDTDEVGIVDVEVLVAWTDGLQTFNVDGAVDVEPVASSKFMLVRVQDLTDHMSGVHLNAAQTAAAERTLAGLQRSLERRLLRRFVEAEATEWAYADEAGWAMLTRTPVKSIISIGGPLGLYDYGTGLTWGTDRLFTRNGLNGLYPLTWARVTYRGGGLDDDELDDVKLAILEKAAGMVTNLHDDTRTVKDLDTREPTARPVERRWTDADLDEYGLTRLRRRVVI